MGYVQRVYHDNFEFSQIKGSIDPQKIGFKITDAARLDEFKDKLIEGLNLRLTFDYDWEAARDKFLADISHIQSEQK